MNCREVRELLLSHLEGDPELSAGQIASLRGHLSDCAACRAETENLREQLALLRGAGGWAAERGEKAVADLPRLESPAISRKPASEPEPAGKAEPGRRSRPGPLWLAAAVAAALLGAVGLWPLLSSRRAHDGVCVAVVERGQMRVDGLAVEAVRAGEQCRVTSSEGATLRLSNGAVLWASGGADFSIAADSTGNPAVQLAAGSAVCSTTVPVELRSTELVAHGCGHFAVAVPGPAGAHAPAAHSVAQEISEFVFPTANASEAAAERPAALRGAAAFVLLAGWAEVRAGRESLSLVGCRAVLLGGGAPPAVGQPQWLMTSTAAERRELLGSLLVPRYRAVADEFGARRAEYLGRLTGGGLTDEERADLCWRITLLGDLREAHVARIGELARLDRLSQDRAELLAQRRSGLERLLSDLHAAEAHMLSHGE